jgi:hypothetical protein
MPLVRLERKWKDNINIDLKEIYFRAMAQIHLALVRVHYHILMNTLTNLRNLISTLLILLIRLVDTPVVTPRNMSPVLCCG